MKTNPLLSLGVTGLLALPALTFGAMPAGQSTDAPVDWALPSMAIPDRYIVELVDGVDAQVVAGNHGVGADFVFQHAARGFSGTIPPGRLAHLRADPRVLRVIPDRVVVAIGKVTASAAATTTTLAQVIPAGVKRIGATPGTVSYTGSGVGIAVVDTGVDINHKDLKPFGSISFTAYGNSALDNNGHGTHVAGIIAARNNAMDVVGVAPAATLYVVKVLDANGAGTDSAVIAGLDWIAKNAARVSPPIRVVNMSLGRAGNLNDNAIMHASITALYNLGITVVVAAGNDATLDISQQIPAAYPEVITVASTTAMAGTNLYSGFSGVIGADTASYFTSDGTGVTVSAPGEDNENISSTGTISTQGILSTKLGGGTVRMSGTSMAAPHVAGVAALVYQKNKTVRTEDIRDRVSVGALSQGVAPLTSPTSSYTYDGVREGVLNVAGALAAP